MMRPSRAEAPDLTRLPSRHPFWAGYVGRYEVPVDRLRAGAITIEVTCAGPRYVTLCVEAATPGTPTLIAPLEPRGGFRYGRTFLPPRGAVRAWLEVSPQATPAEPVGVTTTAFASADLAALVWRAVRRHARSPGVLFAKGRQVLRQLTGRGAGHVVFRREAAEVAAPDADEAVYARWCAAFESPSELARIDAALTAQIGDRAVRVLAVAPPGGVVPPAGVEEGAAAIAWIASLVACARSEVHLCVVGRPPEAPPPSSPLRWASVTEVASGSTTRALTARLAAAAHQVSADLVVVADRPGRWPVFAVAALALELALHPRALAVYGDHDRLDAAGQRGAPVVKPVWSPAYQAACGYIAQPVAFRPDALASLDVASLDATTGDPSGDDPGDLGSLSDRWLAALAAAGTGHDRIRHVPRVLFHETPVERGGSCAVRSTLSGRQRVAQAADRPAVSVILPTKDNPQMLRNACAAVFEHGGIAAEIVIVDNGSTGAAQAATLADLARRPDIRVIVDGRPFNFSQLINTGRGLCRSETLLLLNDDVEALPQGVSDGWLAAMVEAASPADVGAVGALLLYPDGRLQHGGVILGINGGAGHAHRFASADADIPGDRLSVEHEVAAVTGACLVVRAAAFDDVGGFCETLPVTLNDVDFCLALLARGYRNLMVPQARLIHRESTTRGLDVTPERLARLAAETALFQRRWGRAAVVDPFASPHHSTAHEDLRRRRL